MHEATSAASGCRGNSKPNYLPSCIFCDFFFRPEILKFHPLLYYGSHNKNKFSYFAEILSYLLLLIYYMWINTTKWYFYKIEIISFQILFKTQEWFNLIFTKTYFRRQWFPAHLRDGLVLYIYLYVLLHDIFYLSLTLYCPSKLMFV